MAMQISYTNQFGDVWAESFWILKSCNIDRFAKRAILSIAGYKNKEVFLAKDVAKIIPVTQTFIVKGESFDEYFASTNLSPEDINPYKNAYAYIVATVAAFAEAVEVSSN